MRPTQSKRSNCSTSIYEVDGNKYIIILLSVFWLGKIALYGTSLAGFVLQRSSCFPVWGFSVEKPLR